MRSLFLVACGFLYSTACFGDALSITFDDFVSSSNNQLMREFNQTGATIPYVQSPTDGIVGGSVTAYSGNDYQATAVYNRAAYDLSAPGTSVALSLDLYFHPEFRPLAPGANGVRSFRLGLLDSPLSSFETVSSPSVYLDGVYAIDLNKMLFVARSVTQGSVSLTVAESALTGDHWYRLNADFVNAGNDQIQFLGSFSDLGVNGGDSPSILALWDVTLSNPIMARSSSTFASFSILADGGILRADNLAVPVPEPSRVALIIAGIVTLITFKRIRVPARIISTVSTPRRTLRSRWEERGLAG